MKKYLLDENIPYVFANALKALCENKYEVKHLREEFPLGTLDVDWITKLKEDGNWVIISQDKFKKEAEKEILKSSELVCFILPESWATIKFWDRAWKFVKAFKNIVELKEKKMVGGTIFKVQANAEIQN